LFLLFFVLLLWILLALLPMGEGAVITVADIVSMNSLA
jgi:hypothetical protein